MTDDRDRPRLSVFIATSLDGFIARRDGSVDWLEAVARPDEDHGYHAFFDSVDALVMGRNTYDTVLAQGSWPYGDTPCFVLTHRPATGHDTVTFVQGTPDGVVAKLERLRARRVYVDGGEVIRQFLSAGLIDDMTLSIIPVLLGDGIPLFGPGGRERPLALVEARSWPSGLCQLHYRVG